MAEDFLAELGIVETKPAREGGEVWDTAWAEFERVGGKRRESRVRDLPGQVDPDKLEQFAPFDQPLVAATFEQFRKYLGLPLVTDRFDHHKERSAWRKEAEARMSRRDAQEAQMRMEKMLARDPEANDDPANYNAHEYRETFNDLYLKNKLNINKLQDLPGYTAMLLDLEQTPDDFPQEDLTEIMALSENFTSSGEHNPWDRLEKAEKLRVVGQLERRLHRVLEYLGGR